MNKKLDQDKITPTDAWLKTISDIPVADANKKAASVIKSPYAVSEMPPEVKIGEILGSGTILKVLGEGGFARVYKIHDDKLDLDRAVKVLLPTGKKEVSDRFLTEARITARLDNPYIVKVFRVDEWHGCPFIEMEFIDGKSLETILQERGTFPVYAACAVGIFIASALKYAHTLEFTLSDQYYKGVIHRDLKPANIMLHNDGRLKLMDFGIARPISTGLHTMGENIVGTLQYLSPEQLNHKGIDQRTDIYALGAILYELLCGIKAFPDEGLTDLVNKKAGGIYKPFIEFPVSIPKKLSEIVDKCLNVNKEERYSDAEAFIDAISNVYKQFSSVEPEIALKNFMEDPDYLPPVAKSVKKKLSVPRVSIPQVHLPKMPQIRLPEFPKPKLPRMQFPKEQLFKLHQFLIRGVNGFFKAILRFLLCFWNIPKHIVSFVVNGIKCIPKAAFKITAVVFAGIIAIATIFMALSNQFTEKKSNITVEKQVSVDTVAISQNIPPATTDSVKNEPTVPVLLSPDVEEVWKSETLKVLWNSIEPADSFIIHIASSEEFLDTVCLQVVINDTSCSIIDIEPGMYCCRIGVTEKNGGYNWSVPHFFNFSPVYHTPHLIAPSREDTCSVREVAFKWNKVPKARAYFLNVAIDSNFEQLIFNDTCGYRDTFINVVFYDTSLVTYFWHVRAKGGKDWSSTRSFTISDKKDYHAEAARTLRKGMLLSVEKILPRIAPTDQYRDTLIIRLAEVYLKTKNFEKVKQLFDLIVLNDMMVEYLRGQILINEGDYISAYKVLDTAIDMKTCFATRGDSSNVFYLRAVAAQKVYSAKKGPEKGSKAYYAWDDVKKIYDTDQSNARYREALVKMNQLYYKDKVFGTDSLNKEPATVDSLKQPTGKKKKKGGRSFRLKSL